MFAPSLYDVLITVLVGNLVLAALGISFCGLLAARLVAGLGPRAEHRMLWATLALLAVCPGALVAAHSQTQGIWPRRFGPARAQRPDGES